MKTNQYDIAYPVTLKDLFSAEGFYRVYPSAEKPMNRTFAEKLKLLKEKQGILPCYAIRVEKHQKHPVVFEKLFFLKALDLF